MERLKTRFLFTCNPYVIQKTSLLLIFPDQSLKEISLNIFHIFL
nr:MAG TPA_asm: hypothetical protein [Caudoviricetes sp.]DAN44324.1 MAG TPA: hypothetical protein [Bacteriophage sp.]DAV35392.1 MAG TPA: hypothetical protein [Bacteriophage sp.]DAW36794.1 MAG TPA: hypothetical protein [Caudoviricetes sp.]DAX88837.1 MAG TPA: hypothetical protein [Caudoviricetes sp.]